MSNRMNVGVGLLFLAVACTTGPAEQAAGDLPEPTGRAVVFEAARLIVGDGTAIENGVFVVDGDTITAVGGAGEVQAPAEAQRVDLTGKTVIPAMIDAHAHLGYENYMTWEGVNYTRENVIEHLNRYAFYGFSAVLSTGTDPDDLALELQREQQSGAFGGALFLFAAGMAPPNQGPNDQLLKNAQAMRQVIVRGAANEESGRLAVQEIAAKQIPFIKIWVDDRGGTQQKLQPDVYRAIIDEAAKHDIAVMAHQQNVADMKELLRAGIVGFLHGRIGPAMDEELITLMKDHDAFLIPNIGLGDLRRERVFDDPFLQETVTTEVIDRLRDAYETRYPDGVPTRSPEQERAQKDAFTRLAEADVQIVLGTDAGGVPDHFFGYTGHKELEIFVRLGMTPMQAIVAATKRAAERIGLTHMGTLAPGRRADFVVLDANPLEDIRNTQRIANVYLQGQELDRAALRAEWTSPRNSN